MYLRPYTATEIKKKFVRLSKSKSEVLRRKFEKEFCSTDSEQYKYYKREPGYMLWDCMIGGPRVLTIQEVNENPPFPGDVYVFWDVNERDEEMFKLGKYYLHQMPFEKFLLNYFSFPQETYVFDEHFKYSIVLSHEHFHSLKQDLCLYSPHEEDNWYLYV
ncbi:hypothetical protein [Paenibacillus sp. IITD108]|uniref:hypothetical protein n=1 Tax=Paenibacillus sp. IITD108 TaxID=3116649 RepID=UPI002F3F8693